MYQFKGIVFPCRLFCSNPKDVLPVFLISSPVFTDHRPLFPSLNGIFFTPNYSGEGGLYAKERVEIYKNHYVSIFMKYQHTKFTPITIDKKHIIEFMGAEAQTTEEFDGLW